MSGLKPPACLPQAGRIIRTHNHAARPLMNASHFEPECSVTQVVGSNSQLFKTKNPDLMVGVCVLEPPVGFEPTTY